MADKSDVNSTDFFIAQYNTLRAEILYLMDSNEKRIFTACGFVSALWTILATLIAAKISVPAFAVILPSLILILALKTHITHSLRVSNIGSFLGYSTQGNASGIANWELEIAKFAKDSGVSLSAGISSVTIYIFMIAISCAAGISLLVYRTFQLPDVLTDKKYIFFNALGLDAAISVTLVVFMIFSTFAILRNRKDYSAGRQLFDKYWKQIFSAATD